MFYSYIADKYCILVKVYSLGDDSVRDLFEGTWYISISDISIQHSKRQDLRYALTSFLCGGTWVVSKKHKTLLLFYQVWSGANNMHIYIVYVHMVPVSALEEIQSGKKLCVLPTSIYYGYQKFMLIL